ncbi:hypothetical protein NMY22_g13925 [Coprinellus aureogranulatus]|nr:hypothetical protein NMY22_g13925 [Coprinellus aureogranulatus]
MSPPRKVTPHTDPFDPFDWNTPSFDSIPNPEPMTLFEYYALHATVRLHRGTGTGPPIRYIGNVDYYSPEWLGLVGRARHTAYNYNGEEIVQENTTEDLSRPEGEAEKTFSGTELERKDEPKNCALKRKGESNAPNGSNPGTSKRAKTSSAPTASGTDVPSANTAISCTSKEAETAVEGTPPPHDSPSFQWDDFLELSPGRLPTATPSPARTEALPTPRLQEDRSRHTKSSSPNTLKTARIAEPPRSPQRPVSKLRLPESARKVVGIATPAPEPRPQPSLEIMQTRTGDDHERVVVPPQVR